MTKRTAAYKARSKHVAQRRRVIAYNTATGEEYIYVKRASIKRVTRWSVIDRYGKRSFLLDKNLTLVRFHDESKYITDGID